MIIQWKKRTCWNGDIDVHSEHRVKFKESENKDRYLVLPKELQKQRIMKVTVVPIVIGALGNKS